MEGWMGCFARGTSVRARGACLGGGGGIGVPSTFVRRGGARARRRRMGIVISISSVLSWGARGIGLSRGSASSSGASTVGPSPLLLPSSDKTIHFLRTRLTPSADEGTTCASQSCTRKATPPHLFCPLHLCSSPACPNPTAPPLTLCPSHKCALPHCASPRWTGAAPSPFCAQHACQYPSCGDRADGATGRCREHGRCRVEGCGRGAEGEAYCGEHRRRGCVGCQDQWAGWGVAI